MSSKDSVASTPSAAPRRKLRARASAPVQRRSDGEAREKAIVAAAITLFSEIGFEATTRDLAARLGVTQPLIFRYFPTKEALIERVYQEVFVANWKPEWDAMIAARDQPLNARLTDFYQDYARTVLRPEWIRLFMFSGLKGVGLNTRILRTIRERIFAVVIAEIRLDRGLPPPGDTLQAARDLELVWGLHAAIFYLGMRRFVFDLPVPDDLDAAIADKVTAFLDGAPAVMAG
ncbi:MAG: helix-turn-helix domain-containing protein [Pseudomonadota bacterium]